MHVTVFFMARILCTDILYPLTLFSVFSFSKNTANERFNSIRFDSISVVLLTPLLSHRKISEVSYIIHDSQHRHYRFPQSVLLWEKLFLHEADVANTSLSTAANVSVLRTFRIWGIKIQERSLH